MLNESARLRSQRMEICWCECASVMVMRDSGAQGSSLMAQDGQDVLYFSFDLGLKIRGH